MMRGSARHPLLAILILSVLLRLAAALYLGNQVAVLPGTYDQVSYDALAQRVAAGQGFSFDQLWWPVTRAGEPTAHWSFLYTGFLAGLYALLGHQPLVARLLQALCVGILQPLGAYLLAREVVGRRAALWAAGATAVYIYFIYYGAALMTETPTITAVLWLLVLACRLAETPTWRRWTAFGVLVGIAGLLRQVTLLPVPLLCFWILWRHRTWRSLGGVVLAALLSLMLILPVTLRNARVFDRFVLVNTNAGYAFYFANHPVHGTDFQGILPADGPGYRELIPTELLPLDEAALNDALMARGWGFVRQDPVRYLRLSLSRFEDYFKFWPARDSSRLSNLSRVGSFGLFLPFMLAGLYLSRRRWRACMPLYLFAGAYTLLHLLSWALIRYRLPVDAVLLVFAGAALERIPLGRWAATGLGEAGRDMSLIEGQGRMQDRADRWLRQVEPRQLRALVVVAVLVAAAWLGPRASRTMLLAIVALLALGLALRRPRLQLPMLLLAAAFVPLEIGTGTDSSINIALIGVAGLTGLGLIQAMLGGDLRLRPAPANLPWLVLILVAGLSVVAGAALWSPWVVTKNSFILVQGAQWSIFALSACAYWLGAHRVSDRDQLGRLVVLLLALGAGFLVVNFMPGVYRFGGRILLGGPVFRICVVALASSLALFRPELDRRLRLGLGLLAVLVIGLAYLRGSDWASGWLPALFGLLLVGVLWAWERMQWRVLPYALFAAILGAFFVLPWLARGDVYSLDTRMIAWNGIVQLLEGRWLLGLGLASYWHYWRGVLGSISYWDPKIGYLHYTFDPTVNLHNNYLDMVAQMGFLGLAALLWLLAALTLHIWRRYQAEPPGFGKAYAAAALATLGAMAASGMLGDWFFPFVYNIGLHGFRDSFVGWMLLGGVVALDATAADPAASMPGVREPSPAEREPSPADGAAAANRVEAGSA